MSGHRYGVETWIIRIVHEGIPGQFVWSVIEEGISISRKHGVPVHIQELNRWNVEVTGDSDVDEVMGRFRRFIGDE